MKKLDQHELNQVAGGLVGWHPLWKEINRRRLEHYLKHGEFPPMHVLF